MNDQIVEIAIANDHLLVRDGAGSRRLRYQGNGIFAQDGRLARLHFREKDGTVGGFAIARYGTLLDKAVREN